MRALAVKLFQDKDTKRIFRPGRFLEISAERFEEINSTALGVFLVSAEKPEPKNPKGRRKNAKRS
jgi:hypothetical protein